MHRMSRDKAAGVVHLTLQNLPDLAIRCEDRTFKIHHDQIMEKSTLLKSIQYNGIHDGMPQVEINDIKPEILSCVLDFLYTGDFDETGKNQYVPSSVLAISKDEIIRSPPSSPSSERHKRLAAISTVAQKYKMAKLQELVEAKFASSGKISTYLDGIIADAKSEPSFIVSEVQTRAKEVVQPLNSSLFFTQPYDPIDESSGNQSATLTGSPSLLDSPAAVRSTASAGQAASKDLEDGPLIANIKCNIAELRARFLSLEANHCSKSEDDQKVIQEQSSRIRVLLQERLQAELCREMAQSRLDGLIEVLNEAKRCGNSSCGAYFNVLVQENEVRGKGNVTIRCRTCNARRR
ncbi:hypothetical protein ABW21_db0208387 [Orbilia brochopaga]|nr:hypothetical protein ABW21_db0208387 [Drechslerella brochopaga]